MKIVQLLFLMVVLLSSLFMDIIEGSKYYDHGHDGYSRKKSTRKKSSRKKSSYYSNYYKKKCKFGRGLKPFNSRTFDILDTEDCTCNNFLVQYKLAQIATDYNFHVGIISANRNGDDPLPEKGKKAFVKFSENFIDDFQFYRTALFEDANTGGSGGLEWNTLKEFLETGNPGTDDKSIVDLLLTQDTTLIYTNPNWIVTDCTIEDIDDESFEITTLKSLFTLYRRPDDDNESDVLQRQFETLKFIRRKNKGAFTYLIYFQDFQGTRFSLDNQSNQRDTEFSTFDHPDCGY